jgi:hypothetical protein
LLVSEHIDGFEHVILPDRNIASRMAQVARTGVCEPRNSPSEVAVQLMAFVQATNSRIGRPATAAFGTAERRSLKAPPLGALGA